MTRINTPPQFTANLDQFALVISLNDFHCRLWTEEATDLLTEIIDDHVDMPVIVNTSGVRSMHSGHVTAVMTAFKAANDNGKFIRCVISNGRPTPVLKAMSRAGLIRIYQSEQSAIDDILMGLGMIDCEDRHSTVEIDESMRSELLAAEAF